MADFIYVHQQPSSSSGLPRYAVTHSKQHDQRLVDGSVLAIHIKYDFEWLPPDEWLPPVSGGKIVSVGRLELAIIKSELEVYDKPELSRSGDSGALYLGHFLDVKGHPQFGMLLQYLAGGEHTSAHSHGCEETYVPLRGLASVFVLPDDVPGRKAEEVRLGHALGHQAALAVPKNHYHPLSALTASLTLIVTDRKVVEDQVYGTRNNHHRSMSFGEFSKNFIVSGTQRTHGPSAAAKEAGSQ